MKLSITPADGFLHLPDNSRFSLSDRGIAGTGKRAIFLDRDGVMVKDVHFLKSPRDLSILPGVFEALKALAERFYLVVVTNQSGIARGFFSEDDLLAIDTELVRRLDVEDVRIDAIYYCPHLPGAPVKDYDADCDCRKPRSGMLVRAVNDWGIDPDRSFLLGDSPRDVEAGEAAGVRSVLLGEPGNGPAGRFTVAGLDQAVRWILACPEGLGVSGSTAPMLEKQM